MGKESKMDLANVGKGKSDDLRPKTDDTIRLATYNKERYIVAKIDFKENIAFLFGKVKSFEEVMSKKKAGLVWNIVSDDAFSVKIDDIKWESVTLKKEVLESLVTQ